MAKDNLATQTDNVLVIVKEKPPMSALPNRTNNWMSVQGNDDWEGLSDEWAEDKESYKVDAMSKGFNDTDMIDVMDRDQLKPLISFISNHEMGPEEYENLENKDEVINKGLDMAYEYILSDDYSLKDLIK